jgi:8-oxo-dGTP pyrophosphatase MutT (NUDIX family)
MSPDFIRKALSRHEPKVTVFTAHPDRAAVALVLAGYPGDTQICFIRRSTRTDDPWSGQMAFPGGRVSPEDLSAEAVAERETWEELGLRLESAQRLGALSELPVHRAGAPTSTVLSSFVYHVGPDAAPLAANQEEVAEAYWAPLSDLWDEKNADHFGAYPAIRFHGHFIWGLTLRVLAQFAEAVGRPLPARLTARGS